MLWERKLTWPDFRIVIIVSARAPVPYALKQVEIRQVKL